MKFAIKFKAVTLLGLSLTLSIATSASTNNEARTELVPIDTATLYGTPQNSYTSPLSRTSTTSQVPWAQPNPAPAVPGIMPMNSNPMLLDLGGTTSGVTSGAETFGAPSGL